MTSGGLYTIGDKPIYDNYAWRHHYTWLKGKYMRRQYMRYKLVKNGPVRAYVGGMGQGVSISNG